VTCTLPPPRTGTPFRDSPKTALLAAKNGSHDGATRGLVMTCLTYLLTLYLPAVNPVHPTNWRLQPQRVTAIIDKSIYLSNQLHITLT
jgi:hypothetical protein